MTNDTKYWWTETKDHLPTTVTSHVRLLRDEQNIRLERCVLFSRMYSNVERPGFGPGQYATQRSSDALTLNIVKNMVDGAKSKLGTRMPRTTFMTSGGTASQRRLAKDLTKFIDGAFYAAGMYDVAPTVFFDAELQGDGFLKFYEDQTAKAAIEKVFPWEIVVDEQEAMYGKPRSLFQLKTVNRSVLIEEFPDFERELAVAEAIDSTRNTWSTNKRNTTTQVIEGWHLPSGPNATDGRHVIVCGNALLVDEPWKHDDFPFCHIQWSQDCMGFFGIGLAKELMGLQYEINELLNTIQFSLKAGSIMRWLVPKGSGVNESDLIDVIGSMIEHTPGLAPQLVAYQAAHPDLFKQLESLITKAYEITGINRMTAQGADELGANTSALARQELYAQQSERFASVTRSYEKLFLDGAKQILRIVRDIHERDGSYQVTALSKARLDKIDWKQIDLSEDDYVMQVFPTGLLSMHPAGRLEKVNELMRMGLITDKDIARKLLDFPDLENEIGNENSLANLVDEWIEAMLERHEWHSPESFMGPDGLTFAKTQATQAYFNAELQGEDPVGLELLRSFIEKCQETLDQIQQAAMAQAQAQQAQSAPQGPPPGPMPPQGQGMPPGALPS